MKISCKLLIVISCCLLFFSCKTNIKSLAIDAGEADFSRYVAVGNSLTSGYADGALYREGQLHSYPNMLAAQFALVGGGSFRIPLLEAGAGNDGSGNARRILSYTLPCGSNTTELSPVFDPAGATPLGNISANGPYNLVGVPGARSIDAILPMYSNANPFLTRFCQTPNTSTMLSEAMRINPTFFTLWLGSNDVLLYALGGAVPPQGIYDPATITDTATLRLALINILDSLTQYGAKGAIANVPDIVNVPYFTTIPWNGLLLTQGMADTLNVMYASAGLSQITWQEGPNGFVISDETVAGKMRHATANDLILLSTPIDSLHCAQWGAIPSKALPDKYVLTLDEIASIQVATDNYNQTILQLADKYHLAHVDIRSLLKRLKSGLVYNGISLNTQFVSGGAFSLDGVHPNPRGYALIANEFIKAVNLRYQAHIPEVNATQYPGILFP